jgi:hypothetical protein
MHTLPSPCPQATKAKSLLPEWSRACRGLQGFEAIVKMQDIISLDEPEEGDTRLLVASIRTPDEIANLAAEVRPRRPAPQDCLRVKARPAIVCFPHCWLGLGGGWGVGGAHEGQELWGCLEKQGTVTCMYAAWTCAILGVAGRPALSLPQP